MSFAEVNGIKLCYESHGNGFPIILLHGFGSKKEIWKPQIKDFSKKYRVIAFDRRGTGRSERPDNPYTMEDLLNDIYGLIDYLQIRSTHLIGRSFGGMVAQNFVLKFPDMIKKLVLIATYAKTEEEHVDLIVNNRINGLKLLKTDPVQAFWNGSKVLFHQKFQLEMKRNLNKKFYGDFSAEDLIEETTIFPSRSQDIRNQGNAMKEHNTLNRLHEIQHETLLLGASHDRLIPKKSMLELNERISNSTLKFIEKAGHFMTLSRAEEINRIILDFLDN
jgi:pimeloyl-ACP methyl ester carboxylesterase